MNTSDGTPGRIPDIEELGRLASQYFGPLGDLQIDGYPLSISPPPPALVPDASMPGTVNPGPSVPAMPGDLSGLKVPAASPIYFLEEARPAFAEGATLEALRDAGQIRHPALPEIPGVDPTAAAVPGLPELGYSQAPPPAGEAGFASIPEFSFLEGIHPAFDDSETALDPAKFAEFLQPPTPALPSELGPVESLLPGFSFMEDARPIFSYPPAAPAAAPNPAPGAAASVAKPSVSNLFSGEYDVEAIRREFPILQERVNGRPLVWLDNAATTQKPQQVIDRLSYFYAHENSNVHRAAHELAARSTDAYESAREKVRRFLNAPSAREIIWVRGTTEGINLVAQSWGRQNVREGDEVVITWLEHHANIVPWQMLCSETGAKLRVAPVDDTGQIVLEEYEKLLGPRTRLVAVAQVSNALGTVTPVKDMIDAAHRHGARVLVDGAQSVSHMPTDVQALNCDFYVLSGHKMFGPTGIGAVFGKSEILDYTRPWQGGGNMITDVEFDKTVYNVPPARFEAGTGNIADAVGLGAAIDYLERIGMANVSRHETELLKYGTARLGEVPGLRIIGTAREKAGVLSFVIDGVRNEEIGEYLNRDGIAVRAGHHCAQPIHRRFGLESTVRASLAMYNRREDLDALVSSLKRLQVSRRNRS
jgi:cysteine desulfurase / selenocysteine lyase